MIGPRKEYPCGCVYDTIDGERSRLVRCDDPVAHGEDAELFRDALKSGFFVHIFAEPSPFSRAAIDANRSPR